MAHELEHIRKKDSLVRFILDIIETIFWWVPTRWLRSRIEEGQEIACDLKCKKYDVDPIDLASAICKSAKYSKHKPNRIFAHNLTKHGSALKRINILLQSNPIRFKKVHFVCASLAVGIAFLVIFLGRFWTF